MKFIPLGVSASPQQISQGKRDCFFSFANERKRGSLQQLQSYGNPFKTYYPAPSELSRNLISQFKLKKQPLVRTKEFRRP